MRIFFIGSQRTRRKYLLICVYLLCLLILVSVIKIVLPVSKAITVQGCLPLANKTIVLDPGHGGYDPGVRNNNVEEKNIVLAIALQLRDYLQASGARVVMTRETDTDLLVQPTAGPKKQEDMRNRMQIVEAADPDIFLSIHANAIGSAQWRGAQVFHKIEHQQSIILAQALQQELVRVLGNTDRVIKPGNYFVLNETERCAALVECGFISNPEEAQLLTDPAYQNKVAWALYLGLIHYYAQPPAVVD
ncbi:MAG TPA: N-acetylmuramoyl-L-alanine amidase [Oscillospiraceae bacterium]|nr:N-acetylmuramoyl-L-alanine amidase [Oscillospiraceae bacterium]